MKRRVMTHFIASGYEAHGYDAFHSQLAVKWRRFIASMRWMKSVAFTQLVHGLNSSRWHMRSSLFSGVMITHSPPDVDDRMLQQHLTHPNLLTPVLYTVQRKHW